MKTNMVKQGCMLLFALALSVTIGFSQSNPTDVANNLTTTMTQALNLDDAQVQSVSEFNREYVNNLFSAESLTDDVIAKFDNALDSKLKNVLNEEQYTIWSDKKTEWLNTVKTQIPV